MGTNEMKTCTQYGMTKAQPPVNVSAITIGEGSKVMLKVYRVYDIPNTLGGIGVIKRLDHYGKVFANTKSAFTFANDRGYLQKYYHKAYMWERGNNHVP